MKSFLNDIELGTDKPWLLVGKGPSFDKIGQVNLDNYYVFGLNEVCRVIKCDIGHFIDVECVSRNFIDNSTILVSPVRPHINFRVSNRYLTTYYLTPFTNAHTKLYCYNCSTYKGTPFNDYGQTIKVKYFSSEAAFRLLAIKGIKEIYTLGIDGGVEYAKAFDFLTPLQNGRKTFDDQMGELNKICSKWDINWIKAA